MEQVRRMLKSATYCRQKITVTNDFRRFHHPEFIVNSYFTMNYIFIILPVALLFL